MEIAFKLIFFFALKKLEKAKIVAFNWFLMNYNTHFSFYQRRVQITRVDSCDTGQKNME